MSQSRELNIELPPSAAKLIETADASDPVQARIARLPVAIALLNQLVRSIPLEYGWRFKSADALRQELQTLAATDASVADLNRVYWRDVLANIEAYTITSIWRMVELTRSTLADIEQENIVACCVVVRSAFESAVQLVHDARTFAATLDGVRQKDLARDTVMSNELEERILKTVFASRLSDADEIYRGTNFLTVLGKVAKIAPSDPLTRQYELLCDVTHPNFLGRSIYLVEQREGSREGDEIRVIAPRIGPTATVLLQTALWSLSWAVEAQCTATDLQQKGVKAMFETFPWLASQTTH